MSKLKQAAIAFLTLYYMACCAAEPDDIATSVANEAAKELNGPTVNFANATRFSFSGYITYPPGKPIPILKAKRDTELVTRKILKKLGSVGIKPGIDNPISIVTRAKQRVYGETREGLTTLGKARYDPYSDTIKFSPD